MGDLAAKSEGGSTPLHCAAIKGRTEVAVLLLQNGASPLTKNNPVEESEDGQSAIDVARNQGHDELAELLEEHLDKPQVERQLRDALGEMGLPKQDAAGWISDIAAAPKPTEEWSVFKSCVVQ